MVTLRRDGERHHDRRRKQEVWRSFDSSDRANPLDDGFGSLKLLNEDRLAPGAGIPRHRHHDAEIITYVCEGALAHEDSTGRSFLIQAGEFQRMTVGSGVRHRATNASRTDWTHLFQIGLRSSEAGIDHGLEQRRFSAAARRGALCVVASPDGRRGSLHIHQDALLYSALLGPGQHVVHELAPGRMAWLQLVRGGVMLGDAVLTAGDGAGVTAVERAVSLTAQEETELLLLDLEGAPVELSKSK